MTLARRFALHVDEMRRMGHRLEHDHEFCRQLQGQKRPLARRQFDLLQGEVVDHLLQGVSGQIGARALEDLTKILDRRQRVRVVRGDPAHSRIDREGDLDHLVEGGLVAGGTEGAAVFAPVHGLERGTGLQHAATAWAQYVPGEVEESDPGGVQEGGNDAFLAEAGLGGEGQRVDPAELAVPSVLHQPLDRAHGLGIGRLPQDRKQSLSLAHARELTPKG